MIAFQRLGHLLCDVPDLDAAFELFHGKLGFPVAWPIGRYWPQKRTCGMALGGLNLELVQSDDEPVKEASIRRIAFEPTDRVQEILQRERIPFTTFEKWESNIELLRLRGMPTQHGAQLLCTNTIPEDLAIEFPFFACAYSVIVKSRLTPRNFQIPNGNVVEQIFLGHQQPERLMRQFGRLGCEGGVQIDVEKTPLKEVTRIVMKNGPIDLGDWPAAFRFVGKS